VALGDQPRIRLDTVRQVLAAGTEHPGRLVFPSYRMRRGHPWLIPAILIPEILALEAPQTMRDFSQAHAGEIVYVNVDTDTILQDLDTPEDYQQALNALQK
jgi:molybdenum cofactor cytidylyltransferase